MPRVNLIQLRGGTAAAWTSANPVLDAREPGIETDTRKIKYGDGSTAWNSLSYAGGGDVAADTVAATSKTTPVDADLIPIVDSAASNVLKKLTWANLKATLKTYFDTLYAATGSTGSLTVIAGTDANTTLTVNRHYELDGDILTANRTYTIPAGTTGDRIRISMAKGNSTHALIVKANTGIQINRGTLAAEWSRLFIVAEYVELRCTNGTNWDVWDDGRIAIDGLATPNSFVTISNTTWLTGVNFGTATRNVGNCYASGKYTMRRSGRGLIILNAALSSASGSFSSLPSSAFYFQPYVSKNGTVFTGTAACTNRVLSGSGVTSNTFPTVSAIQEVVYSTGDTFELNLYQETGASRYVIVDSSNNFIFMELL